MLEAIFGNTNKEKILFYIYKNKKAYAREISIKLNQTLFSVQRLLSGFEDKGLLLSSLSGRTKIFEFNPRYAFIKETVSLLDKAWAFLPKEEQERYIIRKRPRRSDKPI